MAFNSAELSLMAYSGAEVPRLQPGQLPTGARGGHHLYTYTNSAEDNVATAGFFNPAADRLRPGDLIYVVSSHSQVAVTTVAGGVVGIEPVGDAFDFDSVSERTPAPGDEALFWRDGVVGRGAIEVGVSRAQTLIDPREFSSLVSEGNWTPAFNAAHDAAVAEKGTVFVPAGEWGLADSVIVKAPMVGVGAFTPGVDAIAPGDPRISRFLNLDINQPDKGMIEVPYQGNGGFAYLEGFQVYGRAEDGRFCRGITTTGVEGTPHGPNSRYTLKDLMVTRCYSAIDWEGWIGVIQNCHTRRSHFGLTLRNPNGVVVLGGEFSAQGMSGVTEKLWEMRVLEGSPQNDTTRNRTRSVQLLMPVIESNNTGANGLFIGERVWGVNVNAYFEGHIDGYHIDCGSGTYVTDGDGREEFVASTGVWNRKARYIHLGPSCTFNSPGASTCRFDNVFDVSFDSHMDQRLEVTDRALNVRNMPAMTVMANEAHYRARETWIPTSDRSSVGRRVENLVLNSALIGGSRGFRWTRQTSGSNPVTFSYDAEHSRDGRGSLKVTLPDTSTEVGSLNLCLNRSTQQVIAARALGKRFYMHCWVYIPESGGYGSDFCPNIRLVYRSRSGSFRTFQSKPATDKIVPGTWHLFSCWSPVIIDVADTGTNINETLRLSDPEVSVRIHPVHESGSRTGDYSVWVQDLFIGLDVPDWKRAQSGDWVLSPAAGRFDGERVEVHAPYPPSDSDWNDENEFSGPTPVSAYWQKGDIVWNNDADPEDFTGWICTTSGTPGTWKGFGETEA